MLFLPEDPVEISERSEPLREAAHLVVDRLEALAAVAVRIHPRHDRLTRRLAHRDVHMRVLEPHPLRRQLVEVRRDARHLAAIGAQRIPVQVVRRDQQEVRTPFRGGGGGLGGCGQGQGKKQGEKGQTFHRERGSGEGGRKTSPCGRFPDWRFNVIR